MKSTASNNNVDEAYPETGPQFNPSQDVGNAQAIDHPTTPIGESQEIMVGTAGKAILLGDEIDLESDQVDHPTPTAPSKSGPCPSWLRSSSQKTKGLLWFTAILILGFIAVMIVGVLQLSTPSADDDSLSSAQSGQNAAPANPTNTDTAATVPPPTPKPGPAAASPGVTPPPTQEFITVPISSSEVNVMLPAFMESRVPDFSDGLDANEEKNWKQIVGNLGEAISTSLSNSLPAEYSLESIQVEKFDANYIRRRDRSVQGNRHLQRTIHTVVYSSSVTVNCLASNCNAAPGTVASAMSDLAQLDFLRVSVEMETETEEPMTSIPQTPITPVTPITDKPTPVVSTLAPITPSPKPITNEPTTSEPTTPEPTPIPTPKPTQVPVTDKPTGPVVLVLNGREDDCSNEYTPCEECVGECNYDDECEEGLLCFRRRGYQIVPGCEGPGQPGRNYCYDPFADGVAEEYLLPMEEESCYKKDQCGKCKGDCDEDEDCEKGLFCYRRSEFEMVPGCAGQGSEGTDYCFDPVDLGGDF